MTCLRYKGAPAAPSPLIASNYGLWWTDLYGEKGQGPTSLWSRPYTSEPTVTLELLSLTLYQRVQRDQLLNTGPLRVHRVVNLPL